MLSVYERIKYEKKKIIGDLQKIELQKWNMIIIGEEVERFPWPKDLHNNELWSILSWFPSLCLNGGS